MKELSLYNEIYMEACEDMMDVLGQQINDLMEEIDQEYK